MLEGYRHLFYRLMLRMRDDEAGQASDRWATGLIAFIHATEMTVSLYITAAFLKVRLDPILPSAIGMIIVVVVYIANHILFMREPGRTFKEYEELDQRALLRRNRLMWRYVASSMVFVTLLALGLMAVVARVS